MTPWTKTDSINLILVGVVIAALMSGGLFSLLWTYPNDAGSITNAVLEGWQLPSGSWQNLNTQGCSSCFDGPTTVSIGPNSTAHYIVEFQERPSFTLPSLNYFQSEDTYVLGPFSWTPPTTTFPSTRQYVVFTYSFQDGQVGGPQPRQSAVWFTGPQGNLSQSVHTVQYGGTDFFHGGLFGTSIIDASSEGNYTLHYINPLSSSLNGSVVMGPSSVTFTRPYVYVGTVAILIAVAVSIATTFVLTKKMRRRNRTPKLATEE